MDTIPNLPYQSPILTTFVPKICLHAVLSLSWSLK